MAAIGEQHNPPTPPRKGEGPHAGEGGAHRADSARERAHSAAAAVLRGVERRADAIIVKLTPTYTGCPATLAIQLAVEAALAEAGLPAARVETVLSPPWSTDDITEDGRRKLRDYGIAPPARGAAVRSLFAEETVACPKCGSTDTSRISEFGSTACKALWRCEACAEPFDYFKCL